MASHISIAASDWLAVYPPARSLTLDPEALRVYELAYRIGITVEAAGDPPISFSILALALLESVDATSRWFAEQAGTLGPNRAVVRAEVNISDEQLATAKAITEAPTDVERHLSSDQQLLTVSARAVLESAELWAQRVGGTDIGVRHLVASYLLNPPPYHRDQLQRWGVDDARWRSVFFAWVAPGFSWEQWIDASQRAAPAQARAVPLEQGEVKGERLAWPKDAASRSVLENAARWHRKRSKDVWLRYSTVAFALVDAADTDASVRADVQPLWDAVQANRAVYDQVFSQYFEETASFVAEPFDNLNISPRVLNALETARELVAAAQVRPEGAPVLIGPLHLAGALASVRVDAADVLAGLGLDVATLRKALVDHAIARGDSADVWREMMGIEDTLLVGRPVDLNSDEPEAVIRLDEKWTSDPLGIRPDVEAFASLLASRNLEPPLSIGLFGPWGSGKTTFLKRLKQAVTRHAGEARSAVTNTGPYVRHVVHVEFNAWHFAEGALVSSLVDATIRQISAFVKDIPNIGPKDWLDTKLAELESRRRQLDAATDVQRAASKAVTTAQTELTKREIEAGKRASNFKAAARRVWSAAASSVADSKEIKASGVLEALKENVHDLGELRAQIERMRARPTRLLDALGWPRAIFFAALVLLVPAAVAILVARWTNTFDFRTALSTLSAFLAVAGMWIKAASAAAARVDRALSQVVDEYEREIQRDKDVLDARTLLDAATNDAQTAAATVQELRQAVARAEADAAHASLASQTLQLVSSRIEDRSYAKELTTLSIARADLEQLSRILRDQRTDSKAPNDGLRAVDRVILYIDDLDRCKPEDVVRVLQLVHMLLAFELFVVVVAVDARWVEQALKQNYPWLKASGGDVDYVSPEDYLEKIFQIAFWLEPMTSGRAASYLTSLVRTATSATPTPTPTPTVDISSVELDYMRALAAYVGSSPRRVKRLVNAYRLIKARLSDAQLAAFVTDPGAAGGSQRSGPYQIVIGLLVIGTGTQAGSSAILGSLGNLHPSAKYVDVVSAYRETNEPEWTAAAQVIEKVMRQQNANDVSELRGWSRKVGRFLLHGPMTA